MRHAVLGGCAAMALMIGGSAIADGAQGGRQKPPDPKAQAAAEAEVPVPGPVEVRTRLNRTAVWVGDPIVWTVELICAPTVDVIADDLAGEKLALTGLELLGAETERTTGGDGTLTHRVHYRLGAYEIADTQLRVAPFKVRYYERRAGQRAEDVAPAGEAAVPGAVLAWRSTIPAGLESVDLRQDRAPELAPRFLGWARPAGLTLVVMSILPVALWGGARVRELRRPRERRPSVRASRKEVRSALSSLQAVETSTGAERRAAYEQLNELVRRYVSETTGVAAMALTPEEITAGFSGPRARPALAELGGVLAECDQARYGPLDQVPTAERFRDSVAVVERVV